MAKPILVFYLNNPHEAQKVIHESKPFGDDYYMIFLDSCSMAERVELLQKGKNTRTITKKLKKLINLNNG